MRSPSLPVLLLAAALCGPLPLAAQAGEKTVEIPVSSIVLFTSGVAYYQHDGTVEGDARMELVFSAPQVNDLLKSLVLRDLDGGEVASVTYASRDPITRTLKGFSVDLTANPTLGGLLAQTRGEAVEIALPDGTKKTGTIIGVERREIPDPKGSLTGEFVTLNTPAGVASIALRDAQSVRYLRREIQDDLSQALSVLSSSHGVEKKKVVLHFTGTGKRRVRIGYILESPVWKTSYRLVLAEAAQPFLQGWAMVENTSDIDWKAVALTLVSGRPITFTMNLYEPLYVERPEVQLELYSSLRPKTSEMALDQAESAAGEAEEEMAMSKRKESAPMAAKAAPASRESAARARGAEKDEFSVSEGVAAAASGGAVGNLFRYVIDTPVTIPLQQSALLAIVNQGVGATRYSLYNEATHPKFPLNALRLKNSSSLHLMQGPITVFDAGMYAGDAQISDLPPGGEQLISYAMDLDTEVEAVQGPAPQSLVSVRIAKGVFFYKNRLQRERVYNARNRGAKDRTLLIEHPYDAAWTLVEPSQPLERARDVYRFGLPVGAGKAGRLSVVETRTVEQSVALTNLGGDTIAFYIKSAAVSPGVKAALQKIASLAQKISETVDQRTRMEARLAAITADQDRIRANMGRLSEGSDLHKKYVKTLTEQETQIAKLGDDIARLRDQESSQKRERDAYMLSIEVD